MRPQTSTAATLYNALHLPLFLLFYQLALTKSPSAWAPFQTLTFTRIITAALL